MNEEATERRLEREARTHSLGTLGEREGSTDTAKVEVCYGDGDESHAGFHIVHVTVPAEADSDDYANHPAYLAEQIVRARYESKHEWFDITDISAY